MFIIKVLIIPCTSGAGSRGGPTTEAARAATPGRRPCRRSAPWPGRRSRSAADGIFRAVLLSKSLSFRALRERDQGGDPRPDQGRVAAVFCRQYSTFATPGSKSAVLSARCGSFLQTVQHCCHSRQQKCCTVCRKWHACADSTALLLPQNAKVLYCLHKIPKIPP